MKSTKRFTANIIKLSDQVGKRNMRKHCNADNLLTLGRNNFKKATDTRADNVTISQDDALISALVMFQLKNPSLLAFDKRRKKLHTLQLVFTRHIKRNVSTPQTASTIYPIDYVSLSTFKCKEVHMEPSQQSVSKSKQKYWQNHLTNWNKCGLSQNHHCEQQLLALSTFCHWKTKLAEHSGKTSFYPLAVSSVVAHIEDTSNSGLRLVVGKNRYKVELEKDFSTDSLKN